MSVFKINRVNKAIVSLADHIKAAEEIAESIPSVKTTFWNLRDEGKTKQKIPVHDSSPKQKNELRLGAIFPNTFIPNSSDESQVREVILVVDKGEVHNCHIVNEKGAEQEGWNLRAIDRLSPETQSKVDSITHASKENAKLKFFSITIPSNVKCNSCYYFVAKSKDSEHEDRLMLFVSYGI